MTRATSPADRIDAATFDLDRALRLTAFDERAAALFGDSSAAVGSPLESVCPEYFSARFVDELEHALAHDASTTFDVYDARFDTRYEVRATPTETGLTVSLFDACAGTRHQHATVIEAIDDGVVTLDRDRHVLALNPAMAAFLGVDREAVIGDDVDAIIARAGVDDESARAIRRGLAAVERGTADQRRLEVPFTAGADADRIGELRFVPVRGESASVAAVVRDITDRHEYERVIDSLHEVTRWLLESDDPKEICAIAVHAGSDLLDLPISGIWLLDQERGYLDPVAGTAQAYEEFGGFPRFNPGEGLIWDVFESGDVERFDDLDAVEGAYNPDSPIQSEIIAPIGTHGVLMTGSFEPHQFDNVDADLVSTLVDNINAALERAERERVLRERTTQLERQTRRLETIADVLSTDLARTLERIADAVDAEADATSPSPSLRATLERTERLIDDVGEVARNASAVGPRTQLDLADAVGRALETSRLSSEAVVVEGQATLRADRERFHHLLESALDDVAARADGRDVTVRIGPCGLDSDDSRGFYIEDDIDAPKRAKESVEDAERRGDELSLAVVNAVAQAHGWTLTIDTGKEGRTRLEVKQVTTLESGGG
jgi:PAS domain S-box-containing protein